jgi:hypothetical protein
MTTNACKGGKERHNHRTQESVSRQCAAATLIEGDKGCVMHC